MKALVSELLHILSKREKRQLVSLLVLLIIAAGAETIGVGLIYPVMDMISNPARIDATRLGAFIVPLLQSNDPKTVISVVTGALLLIFVIKNLFLAGIQLYQNKFIFEGQTRLSEDLFRRRLHADYRLQLASNTSNVLRVITLDTTYIFQSIIMPFLMILSEGLVALMVVGFLFTVEPSATAIVLGLQVTFAAAFFWVVKDRVKELGFVQQDQMTSMIKWVSQGLGGLKENKVHHTESFFSSQYHAHAARYSRAQRYLATLNQTPRLFLEVQAVGAIVMLCLFFAWSGRDLRLLAPTLAAFGMATFRLLPAANRILTSVNSVRYFTPSIRAIHNEQTSTGQAPAKDAVQTYAAAEVLRSVELKHVSFQYSERTAAALSNINIAIPAGSFVAILGRSGAGKTTLVDVLLGLLRPNHGSVTINDSDIHNDVRSWQSRVGYVPQSVFLIDDSLKRNIALGIDDANISDATIERVIKEAQLTDLVRSLPQGLDTRLGERGTQLSGGQCQRIGIARALYRNPDVLVLDEATSALDTTTEQQILRTLTALKGQKTIVIITHRLSTVKSCDTIFFLQGGHLVGSGSIDQIAKMSPEFSEMLNEGRF